MRPDDNDGLVSQIDNFGDILSVTYGLKFNFIFISSSIAMFSNFCFLVKRLFISKLITPIFYRGLNVNDLKI